MVVIPARSMDEIATDIDNAKATKQLALNREAQADNRIREIESSIETRESSLKDIDRRKDDAKNGKRDPELIALQIESKVSKQAIDLLKRLRDLRKAEIEEAEVEAEHADIKIRVFEMESELQGKRTEYNLLLTVVAGDLTQTTDQQFLRELEVRLLKLQQEQASATQKVASKQENVIGRRMKLHEAQLRLDLSRR